VNRLLDIPTRYLLDRIELYPASLASERPEEAERYKITYPAGAWPPGVESPYLPGAIKLGWTYADLLRSLAAHLGGPDIAGTLFRVMQSPSPEELADLGLLDAFYERSCAPPLPLYRRVFFCPAKPALPPWTPALHRTSPRLEWGTPELAPLRVRFWDFDESWTWREFRRAIQNSFTADQTLSRYPWPAPAQYSHIYWNEIVGPELRRIVREGQVVTEEELRIFITITFLQNYDAIAARINEWMKVKEEHEKRHKLIKSIAALALGAMFSLAAIPTVLAQGFKAVLNGMQALQKIEAAKAMVRIAKQFAASDAAFAGEVERVAFLLDREAAEAARRDPLTPEEIEALTEEEGAYSVMIEGRTVGVARSISGAAELAKQKAVVGDRVEILYKGRLVGLFLVGPSGEILPVDRAQEERVRAMTHDEAARLATDVEAETEEKETTLYWLVPVLALALAR